MRATVMLSILIGGPTSLQSTGSILRHPCVFLAHPCLEFFNDFPLLKTVASNPFNAYPALKSLNLLILRVREREREQAGEGREKEYQAGSELSAQSLMRGLNSQTVRS